MATSLSPECTPLKQTYDLCFNSWFASYLTLVTPPLPIDSKSNQIIPIEQKKRNDSIQAKKVEYELKCGETYKQYMNCLKKAIGEKEGLKDMLTTAREEEPLEAWEGIKVVKESDLKD